MKATQSSWMYRQNILFIEFLFKHQAVQHKSVQNMTLFKLSLHKNVLNELSFQSQ